MEPKLTGYVLAQAGTLNNAANDKLKVAVAGLGIKVENEGGGFYAQAEGGYGTAIYTKAEVGNIFPLKDNNNFGVKAAIGCQYIQERNKKDYYTNTFEQGANSPSWKANDLRGYGEVALTYNSPAFKASLGVRGGVKTSTQASLDGITLADVGETRGTEYPGRTTKGFVTPTLNIEVGKKLRFTTNAALDEIKAGIKLYF